MNFKLLGSMGALGTIAQLNAIPTIAETSTISKLQDLPRATTAQRWLAQEPTPSAAQVTGIQLNQTANGLQIVL